MRSYAEIERRRAARARVGGSGLITAMMTLAAFGPYLTGSIRTEQAVVYLLTLFLAPLFFLLRPPKGGSLVLVGMAGVLVVSLFSWAFPPPASERFESGKLFAGLDNLVLPVAVILIVWTLIKVENGELVLRLVARLIVWLVAANSIIAIISTYQDMSPTLRRFWAPEDPTGALVVADRAAQLGRYSGIFNQPAEAGVAYGLAALLAIWYYKDRQRIQFPLLTLILIGGLLSVSKTFLLCGLPIAIFYLLKTSKLGARLRMLYILPLLALVTIHTGLFQSWSGSAFLTRLFNVPQGEDPLSFYTAGRFGGSGGGGTLSDTGSEVMHVSALSGVGPAGWRVVYDGGLTEVLVTAGLIGVAFHALAFFGMWRVSRHTVDRDRRRLVWCLALFLAGADLGVPSLTANRDATLVWIVVSLLALAATNDGRSPRPIETEAMPDLVVPDSEPVVSPVSYRNFL